MHASYQYTPLIWPPLLTAILVAGLAGYAWRQREVPGAAPFAIGCLFAALWTLASAFEAAGADDGTRIMWARVSAALQLPSITAVACFILEYVWPGRWLTRRNLTLLSLAPVTLALLVITEPLHGLLWYGFRIEDVIIPMRKPLMWGFVGYGYLLGVLELGLLLWLFVRSPRHRAPVALIMAGQVAARVLYLADARLDVYTVVIALFTYAVALFAFRIFDAHTQAREAAITGMSDAMLVLDPSGHLASVNPAAERTFDITSAQDRNRPLSQIASRTSAVGALTRALDDSLDELTLPGRDRPKTFTVNRTRMEDFRGLHVGDLILLRDVTEQRAAQQRLLEQERALATLREREQLARELHDSLGQVLGYAGLQMDSARTLLNHEQKAELGLVLERVAGVLRDAHADLRQQILDLRSGTMPQEPFCDQVQHYLRAYSANYGIAAALEDCKDPASLAVAPDAQAQLFRILQEALSNVRRHSGARRVRVSLESAKETLRMRIADDGHGFDVAAVRSATEGHLGLSNMRERAEQIGGSLTIASGPDGTTVTVTVPGRRDSGAHPAG